MLSGGWANLLKPMAVDKVVEGTKKPSQASPASRVGPKRFLSKCEKEDLRLKAAAEKKKRLVFISEFQTTQHSRNMLSKAIERQEKLKQRAEARRGRPLVLKAIGRVETDNHDDSFASSPSPT